MALKHAFSFFGGVPSLFTGMGAKNYERVKKNALKWHNGNTLDDRNRAAQTEQFRSMVAENRNLSESEMKWMNRGYNARNLAGKAYERTANDLGTVTSVIGGTLGYSAKKTAVYGGQKTKQAVTTLINRRADDPDAYNVSDMKKRWANERAEVKAAKKQRWADGAEKRKARNALLGKASVKTGEDVVGMGKNLYNLTGTKTFNFGVAAVATGAILGTSGQLEATIGSPAGNGVAGQMVGSVEGPIDNVFESGRRQGKAYHTMQQVASNMSVSANGGGAFIRDIAPPATPVDDMGATGDLVFALHSLRNGG